MSAQVEESAIDTGMMQDIVRADGYIWLKYGQKHVHDTYITRCYYRCSCSKSQSSCRAKKTVEYDRRRSYMLSTIHINYSSPHHNHPPPLEKRICEEPSRPVSMQPQGASSQQPAAEAPEKQTGKHPSRERHNYDNASPAAAPPEPSATESGCSASCAVNANLHSVFDPHSVSRHHHDAPAMLTPPATTAAISASSAAAAPEHAAGSSTVSTEFFQQFPAPTNNENAEDDSQTAPDAAGFCSSNCGSCSEGAPIGEAPSIQLFGSSIPLDESSATPSIQNRELSEWSDGGLLDDAPCAKRARRTESAPARFSSSPVFIEAAGSDEDQLQFCSELDVVAADIDFPILPLDVFDEDVTALISPRIDKCVDMFWGECETLGGLTELHNPALDVPKSGHDHSGDVTWIGSTCYGWSDCVMKCL